MTKAALILSFVSCAAGLMMIYYAAVRISPKFTPLDQVTESLVGNVITTEGTIVSREERKGHVFLELSDNEKMISIPLFSDFLRSLPDDVKEDIAEGNKIMISGYIDEYRGQLQIIPRKPEDVVVKGE